MWWVKWMVVGILLSSCGIGLLPAAHSQFNLAGATHRFPIEAVAYLALFISALAMIGVAESKLRSGVRNGIWGEGEMSTLRDIVARQSFMAFTFLPAISWLAVMFITRHWSSFGVVICFTFPLQSVARLQVALRPQLPSALGDWHQFKPLRSEHWRAQPED